MKNIDRVLCGVGIFLALGIVACSESKPHLGESVVTAKGNGVSVTQMDSRSLLPSGELAGEEATIAEFEAVVKSVDVAKRSLVLSLPEGKTTTYQVSEAVRNLNQVKPGDRVKARYSQTVAFELREPTAEERKLGSAKLSGLSRAPKGALPAGAALNAGMTIVTIQSVDKAKQQLTVQLQDGSLTTVQARYPENLALVKKGQTAVITYAESLIAGVERIQ